MTQPHCEGARSSRAKVAAAGHSAGGDAATDICRSQGGQADVRPYAVAGDADDRTAGPTTPVAKPAFCGAAKLTEEVAPPAATEAQVPVHPA